MTKIYSYMHCIYHFLLSRRFFENHRYSTIPVCRVLTLDYVYLKTQSMTYAKILHLRLKVHMIFVYYIFSTSYNEIKSAKNLKHAFRLPFQRSIFVMRNSLS